MALATSPGESAIAVVRLSGPSALSIAARRFQGRRSPERSPSHRILFGTFLSADGSPIDTVLLSVFREPRSYTGEDVVEISSHGGRTIPRAVLESLIACGARPARPGEFTERAYRNGKIDLAQAESVAALVKARSDRAARAARATLGGALSRRVAELDRELVPLLAEVEARIDFPSDVGEAFDGRALAARCAALAAPVREWISKLPSARRREEGLRVALLGRPNVGKSSLLNALVGYGRAIVSETPGTTRDTVEESIWVDGVELRLTDTAGVRNPASPTAGPVERLGLERTDRAARGADLAILVFDRSDFRAEADRTAAALVEDRPVVVAWNKADLPARGNGPSRPAPESLGLAARQLLAEVETVAVRPGGADLLLGALRSALPHLLGTASGEEIAATSARQEVLLADIAAALERAEQGLLGDESYDLIAADLTDARRLLGELVGRGVDQDVIAAVFSNFCIGK
ncbi:MAG: tRNA uridine-5-carboxymethylaminomethyl(34) synthesis GTPase MnmE [Candidatus Latescibacteria bacterium]|nr:tRNA uridine-5-carboxymethylaminomethyl(34) synthesis GTPase MnmE [Candidatus Latescibacterota bacterium]